MDPIHEQEGPFECVEPELGALMTRLDDPQTDRELRDLLCGHLEICDACRLEAEIAGTLEAGLKSGSLALGPAAAITRSRRGLVWPGAAALAAAVLLAMLLPPVPGGDAPVRRAGGTEPHILRPIEGEVVLAATPTLRWTPVPEATAYEVEVAQIGGDYAWSGRTAEYRITLPAQPPLPDSGRFRLLVRPVPADLAGAADISCVFERGSVGRYLGYRASAAPNPLRYLTGLGFVLLLLGLTGYPRRGA